jgi:hypothetical protein
MMGSRDKLLKQVKAIRQVTETMVEDMEAMATDSERGRYLFEKFSVHILTSHRQSLASRFFGSEDMKTRTVRIGCTHYTSAVLLPLYIIFVCFYVFLFGVSLGK